MVRLRAIARARLSARCSLPLAAHRKQKPNKVEDNKEKEQRKRGRGRAPYDNLRPKALPMAMTCGAGLFKSSPSSCHCPTVVKGKLVRFTGKTFVFPSKLHSCAKEKNASGSDPRASLRKECFYLPFTAPLKRDVVG